MNNAMHQNAQANVGKRQKNKVIFRDCSWSVCSDVQRYVFFSFFQKQRPFLSIFGLFVNLTPVFVNLGRRRASILVFLLPN
jgi:hypothetical protein